MGQFLVVTMSSGALCPETLMAGNGRAASLDDTRPGPRGQTQIQCITDRFTNTNIEPNIGKGSINIY